MISNALKTPRICAEANKYMNSEVSENHHSGNVPFSHLSIDPMSEHSDMCTN